MPNEINLNSVPKLYKDTYVGKINDCIFIYTPAQENGIVVLRKGLVELFSSIDGKQSLKQIHKKYASFTTLNQLFKVFHTFKINNIIYFNHPKNFYSISRQRKNLDVWMHVTNECNLRCKYCPLTKTSEPMSEEIIDLALKKIVSSAHRYNFRSVTIRLAGGEALIRLKEIKKIINKSRRLTKKYHLGLSFVLLTNGVLITDKLARWLKQENIGVGVSLDGLAEYHDANRVFINGQGTFSRVFGGINYLQKHGIMFPANITITKKNVQHIPTLVKYLLRKKILFRLSFYIKCDLAAEDLKPKNQDLIKYLKQAYDIIYKNPQKNIFIDNLLDMVSFHSSRQQKCKVGKNYLIIKSDGKIQSCPLDDTSIIGNIFDSDDLIQTMVNKTWSKTRHLSIPDQECKKCPWRHVCCGGCPLHAYNTSKQLIAHSNYCSVYKTLIPEVLKIEAKRLLLYHNQYSS